MSITDNHKANFDTLLRGAENGCLCLLETTDTKTGKPVMVICAVNDDNSLVPMAKLFDGNPYEELNPPFPVEGAAA